MRFLHLFSVCSLDSFGQSLLDSGLDFEIRCSEIPLYLLVLGFLEGESSSWFQLFLWGAVKIFFFSLKELSPEQRTLVLLPPHLSPWLLFVQNNVQITLGLISPFRLFWVLVGPICSDHLIPDVCFSSGSTEFYLRFKCKEYGILILLLLLILYCSLASLCVLLITQIPLKLDSNLWQ